MKLRKVLFPSDSRIEWRIKGETNDGHSSQDDDGYHNINVELKAETKEEAVRLFDVKSEEFKQKRVDGSPVYVYFSIYLEMKKGDSVKIIKRTSLVFEKYIREKIVTTKTGRG